MRHLFRWLVMVGTMSLPATARAVVVERVVAVVDNKPILLSELRHRAVPRLMVAALEGRGPSASEPRALKETLDEMIDEVVIEEQAQRAHISVSASEVDRAIRYKITELHLSDNDLFTYARQEGYSQQEYRDEVRRQLLEGKLFQLQLAGPLSASSGGNIEEMFTAWRRELRRNAQVDVRL